MEKVRGITPSWTESVVCTFVICSFGLGFFSTATAGVIVPEEVNQGSELWQSYKRLHRIEIWFETMGKRQKLALQQVIDEIFIYPLSGDDEKRHPGEDSGDSAEYLPQFDEEVPNEATDSRNQQVRSTSNQSFGFHRTGRAGLRGGCGRIPGSFALRLCHFFKYYNEIVKNNFILRLSSKISLNPCINLENTNFFCWTNRFR